MNSLRSYDLSGRKILVTGAASGIGRATCMMLAERGASLALLDLSDAVVDTAKATNGVSLVYDLMQISGIPDVVEQAARSLDGLDGVVNCAGYASLTPLAGLGIDEWNRTLTVNLTAPYLICRAALPWLGRSSSAAIVNIASAVGILPTRTTGVSYATSKAGLLGLTRTLAVTLAPRIRVNAVCPGITDTPMIALTGSADTEDGQRALSEPYPLARLAQAEEVAHVIVFLLSSAASYVTGAAYTCDGGRTLY